MMFAQYLGGSIASMMVNLTQPMAISFPYLSQYGAGKAAKALTKAYADMKGGDRALEGGLQQALKIAEEQGIVAPQEVHQLMAQAQVKPRCMAGMVRSWATSWRSRAMPSRNWHWDGASVVWMGRADQPQGNIHCSLPHGG